MIYLSGVVRDKVLNRSDVGVMLTPMMGNAPNLATTPWGADTGCFAKPEAYRTKTYMAWLDSKREYHSTCLFATAPDKVGDAERTLDLSFPVLPQIRQRVPAALVAQDGLEQLDIPWDEFDCLFMGGSTAWKLSEVAYELMREAKERGKWVHQGRCNSFRRLMRAAEAGADSADGTFLAWAPDINLARMERWLHRLKAQPSMLRKAVS